MFANKSLSYLILATLMAIIFIWNDGQHTYKLPPKSVHVWRQTDCASYALNYYQNNIDFWHPQVHHRLATDGRTISEFPIVYYLASKLYHVFGFHDYYIRIIHFIIFCIGILYVFRLSTLFITDKFLQFFPALIVATSPYLFYYGLNFLPDVPAFSLVFVGLYYFFIYLQTHKLSNLLLAVFICTLACVLKITAGICLVTAALYLIYNYLILRQPVSKYYRWEAVIFGISFIAIASWYSYASTYNQVHQYVGNLLGLLPIWELNLVDILQITNRFTTEWKDVILGNFTWLFLAVCIFCLPRIKHTIPSIYFFIIVSALGVISFSLGWFQAFLHHDYYMINLFCVFVFLAIGAMHYLQKFTINSSFKYIVYASLFALIIKAQFHSKDVQQYRHSAAANVVSDSWYTAQPYMRSIGIDRRQLVLHLGDGSTNISLYLFNNPGWDECYSPDGNIVLHYKNKGAKYLIISNEKWMQDKSIQAYLNNKIGQYKEISFYKL